MIQLKLTNAGLSAFTNTINYKLTLTHFVFGSSYDEDEQAIQDESPVQFNIDFQEIYLKGQTYQRNGSDVVEEYNHIKVIGYFSADNVSTFDENGEYLVKEIALMGSTTENANICLAYGYDVEGVKLIENTNTIYTVKLDLIFENTPNININNSVGTVTYRDFLDHVDKKLTDSTPVHGLQLINNRLYINGQPLTIDVEGVSNAKMNNIIGINEEVEVLPATTDYSVGDIVALKDTGTMYKNTEVLNNNTLENQWIATGSINYQLNTLNSYGSMIPLRTNNTTYLIGDVVKLSLNRPFQYLECIAGGTSGDGSAFNSIVGFMGNDKIGTTFTDGTCIWLVCDMRDGLQVGDIKFKPFYIDNQVNFGYVMLENNKSLLYVNKDNPITNDVNLKYLRLFRLLPTIILTYTKDGLFMISVTAGTNTANTNPYLLWLSAIIILQQWTLTPLEDNLIISDEAVDMINISAFNTKFSLSYTSADYKSTAQTFYSDIRNNVGLIAIRFPNNLTNRYPKINTNPEWVSSIADQGLPNITGTLGYLRGTQSTASNLNNAGYGALAWNNKNQSNGQALGANSSGNVAPSDIKFDASKSNAIYGSANNVELQRIHVVAYLKY